MNSESLKISVLAGRGSWPMVAAAGLAALLLGCPQAKEPYRELGAKDDVTNTAPAEHHDDHDEGPHGGHILELGKYHGELTMDQGRVVTLYILGGDVKTAVPLADASAVLHAHVGNEEKEIPLTAAPLEGETDGKTSRFTAAADAIPEAIKDIEDLKGEVVLTVGGEKTTAEITHDHDHDHAAEKKEEEKKPEAKAEEKSEDKKAEEKK